MKGLKKLMTFAKIKGMESKGVFNTNEHNDKIRKRVLQGKTTEVMHPTSIRSLNKGPDGTYRSGSIEAGKIDGADKYQEVASSAIKSVKYDPSTHICKVQYQGGNGQYYDFMMSPDEFEQFMNSDSKGRYCATVMKIQNRMPGY